MAGTRKKFNSKRPRSAGNHSGRNTRTRKPSRQQHSTQHRRAAHSSKAKNELTYVFECTRPGCGYRIWRDDKSEEGKIRYDLKCPKCHNREFRCLGKGDLPETFQTLVPTTPLDFDSIRSVDLGSN